jgi:hypothetical protein
MAQLLESTPPSSAPPAVRHAPRAVPERPAREELRRQIARLEGELGRLFAAAFPNRDAPRSVGAAGGPRLLGLGELERTRDRLAARVAELRRSLDARAEAEEANRALIERMTADPAAHRWVRISNEDIGERGCRHWHARPRWGLLGMLAGWWRVKLSSGCPLAGGRGVASAARIPSSQETPI